MAIHGFDIAVGMSPEVCSKRVHIFTVAAQYFLSQDEIDAILHDEELDSYLFTFGEAQKALTIFSLSKNASSVFSDVLPRKGAVPSKKVRRMLGLEECLVYQNVRSMPNITTLEELDSILDCNIAR